MGHTKEVRRQGLLVIPVIRPIMVTTDLTKVVPRQPLLVIRETHPTMVTMGRIKEVPLRQQ